MCNMPKQIKIEHIYHSIGANFINSIDILHITRVLKLVGLHKELYEKQYCFYRANRFSKFCVVLMMLNKIIDQHGYQLEPISSPFSIFYSRYL